MKRVILILLSVILLFVFSTGAGAKIVVDNNNFDGFLFEAIGGESHLSGAPTAGPSYTNTNSVSLNFYINDNGIANINYTVFVKSHVVDSANFELTIEKHIFGPFWQQLSVKWTDTFSEKYHVENCTYQLNEEGLYRAVLSGKVGVDKIKLKAEFEYKKGYLHGDVNGDSRVNASDARLVLRYSAQLEKSELIKQRGDMNSDGKVNAVDARLLLKLSATIR